MKSMIVYVLILAGIAAYTVETVEHSPQMNATAIKMAELDL